MKQTFEQALTRLEEIVDLIENNETTLDAAMKLYKEGLNLSKTCGAALTRYESEISLLQKDAEGAFTLTPVQEA